jgi:hypothetical protein
LQASTEERERTAREGRERKGMEGGARGVVWRLQGVFSATRQKQEVAMVLAKDSHTAAPWDSMKKTKQHLQKSP